MICFVIESPGKSPAFYEAFSHTAIVVATGGHFIHMPRRLTPVGIDAGYREIARRPDPVVVRRLLEAAGRATEIVLALDDDDEGHAIAYDVYGIVAATGKPVSRMLAAGMDPETLTKAFERRTEFVPETAYSAIARRIVDRLIGAVLSAEGMGRGRVSSALLGVLGRGSEPVIGVIRLRIAAADGLGHWVCDVPVTASTLPIWRQRAEALAGLRVPAGGRRVVLQPWNYRDALVEIARMEAIG